MERSHDNRKFLRIVAVFTSCVVMLCVGIPESGKAIEPGKDPQNAQQSMPTKGEVVPGIPGRSERPIASSQPDSRAIIEQPRQIQRANVERVRRALLYI